VACACTKSDCRAATLRRIRTVTGDELALREARCLFRVEECAAICPTGLVKGQGLRNWDGTTERERRRLKKQTAA
jgi:hypothetical protein